jgi:hypothetical protein
VFRNMPRNRFADDAAPGANRGCPADARVAPSGALAPGCRPL